MSKRIRETLEDAFPDELEDVFTNLRDIRKSLTVDFTEKVRRLNAIMSTAVVLAVLAFTLGQQAAAAEHNLEFKLVTVRMVLVRFIDIGVVRFKQKVVDNLRKAVRKNRNFT